MSGETKNYFWWKHLSSITKPIKKKFHRLSWAFYMYNRELRVCCTKAVSSLSDFLCFSCWCSFFYLFMFSQVSFPIFILPTKQRYVSKKNPFVSATWLHFWATVACSRFSLSQTVLGKGRQARARQGKAWATKIPAADLTQCLGGISPSMTCCFSKGCCCSLLTTMISDAVIDNHSSGWLRDARSWWMLVHRHLFQTPAAANWDGKWPTCQSMFTEINITHSVLCNCAIVYRSLCT